MSEVDYRSADSPANLARSASDESGEDEDDHKYGLAKFAAVVKPVAVTMFFATLVAINVRTEVS